MISLFVFVFGLVIGSFLNAVIYRFEKGESALKGRSQCPQCGHVLAWRDLIPVLSFVFLKRKCRYCKKPISWQYPIVEISTAVIFLLITKFCPFGTSPAGRQFLTLSYFWSIASLLIVIFVYDMKYYLISDSIVYFAIAVAGIYQILSVLNFEHWNLIGNWSLKIGNLGTLENALISAILASAFFFAIYFVSKGKWMGFGDVKLAFFMGLFLGFPNILVALFFAFFAGAVAGVALMIAKKKKMNSQVPFGPFLVAGTFFALFFGEAVWNWYIRFLLV